MKAVLQVVLSGHGYYQVMCLLAWRSAGHAPATGARAKTDRYATGERCGYGIRSGGKRPARPTHQRLRLSFLGQICGKLLSGGF